MPSPVTAPRKKPPIYSSDSDDSFVEPEPADVRIAREESLAAFQRRERELFLGNAGPSRPSLRDNSPAAPQRTQQRDRQRDRAKPVVARVWGIPVHPLRGLNNDSIGWYSKTLREQARKNNVDPDDYGNNADHKRVHISAQNAVRKAKFDLNLAFNEYWAKIQALNRSTEEAASAKREYDRETVWQMMINFGVDKDGKRYVPQRRRKTPDPEDSPSSDSGKGERKRRRRD